MLLNPAILKRIVGLPEGACPLPWKPLLSSAGVQGTRYLQAPWSKCTVLRLDACGQAVAAVTRSESCNMGCASFCGSEAGSSVFLVTDQLPLVGAGVPLPHKVLADGFQLRQLQPYLLQVVGTSVADLPQWEGVQIPKGDADQLPVGGKWASALFLHTPPPLVTCEWPRESAHSQQCQLC